MERRRGLEVEAREPWLINIGIRAWLSERLLVIINFILCVLFILKQTSAFALLLSWYPAVIYLLHLSNSGLSTFDTQKWPLKSRRGV